MTQNGTYWLSKVSEGQIEDGKSTKGQINFSTEQFATILFFFLVNFQQLADYVHFHLKDYDSHEFGCRVYYPFNQYKLLI